MNKTINFNYVILFYDVNEKRVNKVFKICKKYLNHHQNSVFRGHMTKSVFLEMKKELMTVVNKEEDFITVIKLLNGSCFEEESIGGDKKIDDIFV
ncbi:MAG: CRISPR-associated endonuclease Cas2 [Lachnospirales bacterium]